MIQELTIIHLQFIAALLMGYDYLISEKLKEKANIVTTDLVKGQQDVIDLKLKEQINKSFQTVPMILSGTILGIVSWGLWLLNRLAIESGGNIWVIIFLFILFLFFISAAFQGLLRGFIEGILPFTLPIILRTISSFLLYSSKGAIAATGMLFLIAAFICRYVNECTRISP